MFVILLTYTQPLAAVDAILPAHREFLERMYEVTDAKGAKLDFALDRVEVSFDGVLREVEPRAGLLEPNAELAVF